LSSAKFIAPPEVGRERGCEPQRIVH